MMTSRHIFALLPALFLFQPLANAGAVQAPHCEVSSAWTSGFAFSNIAKKLSRNQPVTIVAIGSSSTAGAGASAQQNSYPGRLQALIREHFNNTAIRVLNRGVNGEEVGEMLARFDTDVIASKPDLILWQVGTNAILRDTPLEDEGHPIIVGLGRLKMLSADVVLMDPQYVPRVLAKAEYQAMVDVVDGASHAKRIGLFRRFDLMAAWNKAQHLAFDAFTTADGLHMNDWGYDCLARQIEASIEDAVKHTPLEAVASVPATSTLH
jgi:lysophospholipase L1-like esterase